MVAEQDIPGSDILLQRP